MRFSSFSKPLTAALFPMLLMAPVAEAAPKDSAVFDLSLRGIRAGQLVMNGAEANGRYTAAGRLATTGIVAKIRKVSYEAASKGRVKGGKYTPSSYSEKADTGKRVSNATMSYKGGVPQVKAYEPKRDPKPYDVKASTQGGTVDPMTALYAAMRDVPKDQVCALDVKMFDGRRRSQIKFSNPTPKGDGFTCDGEYRRLKGFSPEDLAERTKFPFTVTYTPTEGGEYQVQRISMTTLYGAAVLKRR